MKLKFSVLFVICFLLLPIAISAQDKSVTYYDYYFNKTSKKKYAYYLAKSFPTEDGGVLEEIRNIRTNRVAAVKSYKSDKKKILNGRFELYRYDRKLTEKGTYLNGFKSGKWEYFYIDGIPERVEFYSNEGLLDGSFVEFGPNGDTIIQGNYKDDLKVGEWLTYNFFGDLKHKSFYNESGKLEGPNIRYYENGDTSSFGLYLDGERTGEYISRFENGDVQSRNYYLDGGIRTGYWQRFYENKNVMSEGNYFADKIDGEWKWYHSNGQPSSIENYKDGELIDFQFYDDNGNEENYSDKPEVNPEFPGGIGALHKYLANTINYPPIAQENGIQGRVVLRFVIEPDGQIKDIEVLRGIGGGCDEESIRVVEEMPKWTGGISHNLKLDTYYTLPIKFTLH